MFPDRERYFFHQVPAWDLRKPTILGYSSGFRHNKCSRREVQGTESWRVLFPEEVPPRLANTLAPAFFQRREWQTSQSVSVDGERYERVKA